jgi:trimeric autotransporter adhesin
LTLIRKHWFSLRVICGFFLLSFLLGGCAQNQPAKVTEPLVRHSSVHGGQQPVSGSTLQLYAVGTTGDGSPATPLLTQTVTSDANGNFTITGAYTCPSASTLVYVTATGGNPGLSSGTNNAALALMAALGPCGSLGPSTFISMNELTTVAAVWALAPFMSSYSSIGSRSTDATTLASAFTLASEYVNTTTGTAPGLNVPTGTTVPVAQLNTLADILSSCVNSPGGVAGDGSACGTLFVAAAPSGGTAPVEVIGAGLNIANNPAANVSRLFGLVTATAPFQPMLAAVPADLTVNLASSSITSALSIDPLELSFPNTVVGVPSSAVSVTLTNIGTSPVALYGFSIVGISAGDFTQATNCPGNLASSGTCR